MRIAIPTADNKLCAHFGHCEVFTMIDVDEETKSIINKESKTPPDHQPGILPPWVAQHGVNVVIAGGLGHKAQKLFNEYGIRVIVGAEPDEPSKVVMNYLNNTLQVGSNMCDH